MSGKFQHGWTLPIVVATGILMLGSVIALAAFTVSRDRNRAKEDARLALQNVAVEKKARKELHDQVVFSAYVLCRSQGRSKHDCLLIARGIVLQPDLTVDSLEADVARLGEAKVTKLFIGKDGTAVTAGKVSIVGPQGPQGKQGLQGPAGPRGQVGPGGSGKTGARGAEGPQGQAGQAGQQGPAGQRGEQGPQGPQGQGLSCPGGGAPTVRTLTIPSQGTFQILVCN